MKPLKEGLLNKKNIKNVSYNKNISYWIRHGYKDKRSKTDALEYLERISVEDFMNMMPGSPNEGKNYITVGDRIYDNGLPSEVIAIRKGSTKWIIIEYAVLSTKEIRNRISDYLEY